MSPPANRGVVQKPDWGNLVGFFLVSPQKLRPGLFIELPQPSVSQWVTG